ncbi:MAG: TetR/AcrR family transcriptional regulator [Planctomycetota bacterium]
MPEKSPTRDRLLAAAIELMRTEGESALTTQRLASAVGIVQSGFYRHFRNAEDCLNRAAEATAQALREAIAKNRIQNKLADEDDAAALQSHIETVFDLCRRNWNFVELTLAYRHQKTQFGRVLAKAWRDMEQDVAEHFEGVFARLGVKVDSSQLQRIAISIQAIIVRVGERERNQSADARRAAAMEVTRMVWSIVESACTNAAKPDRTRDS